MFQLYNKNKYFLFFIIKVLQQVLRRMYGEEEVTKQMFKVCREWGEVGGAGIVLDLKFQSIEQVLGVSFVGLGVVDGLVKVGY